MHAAYRQIAELVAQLRPTHDARLIFAALLVCAEKQGQIVHAAKLYPAEEIIGMFEQCAAYAIETLEHPLQWTGPGSPTGAVN